MIYIYILFCIYASLSGLKDAILYGKRGAETFYWNEHTLFNVERGVVLLGYCASMLFARISYADLSWLALSCLMAFSFFHNGFYYETARQINRMDYRFWSDSKTSTAKIEISWNLRFTLFALSVVVLYFYA